MEITAIIVINCRWWKILSNRAVPMILQALSSSSSSSQQSTIKTMESFHWNARAQARNEHFMNTSIFLHFYRMDVDRFPSSKLIKIEHNGQSTDSDRPTFGFLNIYTMKRISPIARMWKWHEWLIDSASMWIISESQNMRDFFFSNSKDRWMSHWFRKSQRNRWLICSSAAVWSKDGFIFNIRFHRSKFNFNFIQFNVTFSSRRAIVNCRLSLFSSSHRWQRNFQWKVKRCIIIGFIMRHCVADIEINYDWCKSAV